MKYSVAAQIARIIHTAHASLTKDPIPEKRILRIHNVYIVCILKLHIRIRLSSIALSARNFPSTVVIPYSFEPSQRTILNDP